ncbi:glycosyltransferase family A protein [Flavobacterium sp. ACN6]|uniref:glycosyltransferase n=1 Tax=Flavobacterium sp. ACN6 TaxID=1920426 RepID=UPI000BB34F3F|nr:glycosyltransferase family A protein [Flavobacterium sp. ACN6]PBJ13872.1 putative glycosyltransferase EpsJ [Flavobacterium sp. ACN6]
MISLVIPVFNSKALVSEMIECVLSQTMKNWELILVDDGSNEDVIQMMMNYSHLNNKIRVIKRDRLPKGAPTCRNIGLENANGEFIMFFDSDDLISSTCLENRIKFMNSNLKIDFGVFRARSFHSVSDLENQEFCKADYSYELISEPRDSFLNFLKGLYPFVVYTNIYRRLSLIENKIQWDENLNVLQDIDFNFTTLSKGLLCEFDKITDYDYFIRASHNENSISSNLAEDKKYNSAKYLIDKVVKTIYNTFPNHKEYRIEFWGFVIFYFNRILLDKSKTKDYVNFCSQYFSAFRIFRLKTVVFFSYIFYDFRYFRRISRILQNIFYVS